MLDSAACDFGQQTVAIPLQAAISLSLNAIICEPRSRNIR
jgi:hypothetical protein